MKTTIAIGVLFGLARIVLGTMEVDKHGLAFECFKDAAHLFMGGLAVSWWHYRYQTKRYDLCRSWGVRLAKWFISQPWQWWLFWALNVVEVSVFALTRT